MFSGGGNCFVINVCQVHDLGDIEAAIFKPSAHQIFENEGS